MTRIIDDIVGKNEKVQGVLDRIGKFKQLSKSFGSGDPTNDFLAGIRDSAFKLMRTSTFAARKVDAIAQRSMHQKKLYDGDKKISKFGNLIGKLGQIAGRPTAEDAAQVLDDSAKPLVRQILLTSKGVLDAMDRAAKNAISGMKHVQLNSIASCNQLKEQSKRILIERASSMSTKIQTFAKQTYGGFMTQDEIDKITQQPIERLLGKVSDAFVQIDATIPDETYDPKYVDEMNSQYAKSRDALLTSSIGQAVEMVGDELAREIAVEVFGFDDANRVFGLLQRRREVVSGLIGATKSVITGGSQIGGAAIKTTGDMVKNIAVGSDGQSGLMGENGLGSTILNTTGDVANTMLNTAQSIGESIFGRKEGESGNIMDITKDVANSMIDCVADVGGSLIDGIGNVAKGAATMVGDMAKGLADFASNAWDATKDMAGGLFDSVKDMLGLSNEEITNTVEDVSEAVDEMMDGTEEDFQDLFDTEQEDLDDLSAEVEKMQEEWDEDEWDEEWMDWEDEEDWMYEDWDDPEWEWSLEPEPDPGTDANQQQSQPQQEPLPSASTTTPMGNDSPSESNGIKTTKDKKKTIGWKTIDAEIPNGLIAMMHDGDQQLFNPYGPQTGGWTMYSFRPSDAKQAWPQIAITPSSFEAIRSMDTMLNNVPFVVVKEYFFKNTASMMIDFVKKIAGMVNEAKEPVKEDAAADTNVTEQSSQGTGDAKSTGNSFMDKVKEIFNDIPLKPMVIDIPYILYFCLRQKVYGNTYIFPYIAPTGTVINSASNESEWPAPGEGGGGLMNALKGYINKATDFIGNLALGVAGSQGQAANLFPAPSWAGPSGEKASFQFDLILINDNVVKARNNYMCANTIIHNNRSIQKAILNFPGALYEVWLPTGQRHLMCTGDFKLSPIGLNRMTPNDFFRGGYEGANLRIGVDRGDVAKIQNPEGLGHRENGEVLPDAYKLAITFKSCLANNMNTAVFQYYVQMTGYDSGSFDSPTSAGTPGETSKDAVTDQFLNSEIGKKAVDAAVSAFGGDSSLAKSIGGMVKGGKSKSLSYRNARPITDMTMGEIMESEDFDEFTEKFNEATYNKKLGKLRTDIGDQAVNSESAVATIKKAQSTVRDISAFLAKLYNAPDNKLWYREDPKEELYTTLKPDYRKMLRDRYQSKMGELRQVDSQLKSQRRKLSLVESQLSTQFNLGKRDELISTKVKLTKSLNSLTQKRDEISDKIIQLDTDIIQSAFDEQDDVVSVVKTDVGFRIFQQVWNEKIMNSYERDKLQYLTSQEKERYFKDKLRELEKFDEHGVLRRPDWFFRVVVLDYIVGEMKRLILWFKDCSWDDFELVYKITRKLRMLQLDLDAALYDRPFNINHTNLFQITDEDAKDYTKIDKMLRGNTLYELFSSAVNVKVVKFDESDSEEDDEKGETKERELLMDRKSKIDTDKQRMVRQDVVTRYWGSEAELTKQAYAKVNSNVDMPIDPIPGYEDIKTLGELKSKIIELKISDPTSTDLKMLLGTLVNVVVAVKESLVMDKMSEMRLLAKQEIQKKDDSALAQVVVS